MYDGFDDVALPSRLAADIDVAVQTRVDITRLASGYERRNKRWEKSSRRYALTVGQRPLVEIQQLLSFFEARRGPLRAFKFFDPFNNSTGSDGNVSADDVNISIGDGEATRFQLADQDQRSLVLPLNETVQVAIDGVVQTNNYTLSGRGVIEFEVPPAVGSTITAGCQYYVPVRFENQELVARRTSNASAEITDIQLLEVDI